jgi:hypothetical protein
MADDKKDIIKNAIDESKKAKKTSVDNEIHSKIEKNQNDVSNKIIDEKNIEKKDHHDLSSEKNVDKHFNNEKHKSDQKDNETEKLQKETVKGLDNLEKKGFKDVNEKGFKAIEKNLEKFAGVFESIRNNVEKQTEFLKTMVNLQQSTIDKLEEQSKFDKLKGQDDNQSKPIKLPNGNVVPDVPNSNQNEESGGIKSMLAGLGGGLGAMVSTYGLKKLGAGGIKAFFAPIIGKWLGEFVEESLKNTGFSDAVAESLGKGVDRGAVGAVIGSMFGKRVGAIFGAAGFASSFAPEILDALGINKENIVAHINGKDINVEQMASSILSAVSGGIMMMLTSPTFAKDVVNLLSASPKLLKNMKVMKLGLIGAIAGLTVAYGDDVKDWLKNKGVNETVANAGVDIASFAVNGASLGSIFGPEGALVGAAIGAAVGLGKSIYDWFVKRKEDTEKKAKEALDKASDEDVVNAVQSGNYSELYGKDVDLSDTRKREIAESRINKDVASSMTPVYVNDKGERHLSVTSDEYGSSLDVIADKSATMTQEQKDKTYTNLVESKKTLENIMSAGPAKPGTPEYDPDTWTKWTMTPEYQQQQQIQQNGTLDDTNALIKQLEDLGAKLNKLSTSTNNSSSDNIPTISPDTSNKAALTNMLSNSSQNMPFILNAPQTVYAPQINNKAGDYNTSTTVITTGKNSDLDYSFGFAH